LHVLGTTHYRPGDYARYLRDVTEAHRKELEDYKLAQFFNDREKQQWTERCEVLRHGLEGLKMQLEAALKTGPAAKP